MAAVSLDNTGDRPTILVWTHTLRGTGVESIPTHLELKDVVNALSAHIEGIALMSEAVAVINRINAELRKVK